MPLEFSLDDGVQESLRTGRKPELMHVSVSGDENEIQIRLDEQVFLGDLFQAAEDPDGDGLEIWEIDGLQIETEQVLCLGSLESLAREFLALRGIEFGSLTVTSDSFKE